MFTPPMLVLVFAPPPLARSLHSASQPWLLPLRLSRLRVLVFIIMYIGYVVNNTIISFTFYCVKISTRKPRNKWVNPGFWTGK